MLRILSGCGGRWGDGLGRFGAGDLREGAGMGRVWLLRVAIHTVFGMAGDGRNPEAGAFYWTVLAPDIVNLGREEQGSVSL